MPGRSSDEMLRFIDRYCSSIPHLLIVPNRADIVSPQVAQSLLGVRVTQHLLLPFPQAIKRAMDVTLTICGGLLALPLIAAIAVAIRLTSPGPVFYRQRRIGYGGRHFLAWKFRTMVLDAEQQLKAHLASSPELRREWERDHKLRNDPRVTAIGRFLRRTSLDELPQLLNVLAGEMSLVGPRPIVDAEVHKYGDAFGLYLRVRPGLTGLWQVSGRNDTGYEQRVRLDMHYVRNWSPWLDVYLLMRTVLVVAGQRGAY
jgi:Undecaprenyl-phosphate galactose phosphotransferase WbaP